MDQITKMSFIKNLLFGSYNTGDDPTGSKDVNRPAGSNTPNEPIVEGKFYPRTLYKYNGHDHENIFIAIKGKVYDCSGGRQFYGPSGPYSNFAGHDASRGLALNSFDMGVVRNWDQPMDDLKDLTPDQREALDSWHEFFEKKYPYLGTLEPEPGVNI